MSIKHFVVALALAFGLAGLAQAAPLEAYGKLPSIEAVSVSPSGKQLAIVTTNGESRIIMVHDLVSDKITLRAGTGTVKVRSVQWAGEQHLVLVTSVTAAPMFILNARREWAMAFTLDLKTGKVRPLLRDVSEAMNTIAGQPVVRDYKGEPTVYLQGVKFVGGRGRLSLFRIDLDTGASRMVSEGAEDTRDWLVGPDGEALAEERYDGRSGRWSLRLRSGSGWREVQAAAAPLDRPYLVGLGRDGQSVLYTINDTGKATSWREARVDGAPASEPITALDDQAPLRDAQDGRLIGHAVLVGDEARYTFFDPMDARVWKAVVAAYPGDRVALQSWSADRQKIVVRVDSPTEGPAYAIVDLATRKGRWVGAEYGGLKAEDIGPQTPVRFKAADGLELTGYLTLPHGSSAKNLPLIVFPHGGPAARDEPGFDWWAQAMASRGYAVLQVNFRGSDGLGGRLLSAGYGEWGRKMQTDLSDGVRYLASQGTIDPKRVCIVGASYGGYAALAGATLDHGVYRCAVSVAGVTDLRKQVAYSRTRGGLPSERYWNRFMGAEDRKDEVLDLYSPAQQAAKADIPILLIHGKDDTVVPIEQSRAMAEALGAAGKPYELVVQAGADHWLSRGDTRLQTLTATMAFVEKYNPPN